jgi:SAM-dependent methyltransferase
MLTQDFPGEEEIGRYYEAPEYISHSDTHKGFINTLYHTARKIALRSKAAIVNRYTNQREGTLLDIGSGTGYFLNKMKSLHYTVLGIEKSDAARQYARQKFGLDCRDSGFLYEIAPKTQDVVTLWHVLEHLESLNRAMEQLNRILKDDGVAIIALPNKNSFDAAHYKAAWAAYDVPRHLYHFSPPDFTLLAGKHGFDVIKTKPMFLDIFYISMLSEKNRGNRPAGISGVVKGTFFFLRTLVQKEKCSSLIYVLKKK